MGNGSTIRVCEWQRVDHPLTLNQRRDVAAAVNQWRSQENLPVSPLYFAGADGEKLCANQYVGVVEVNDVVIEIYPKLDATLIELSDNQPLSSDSTINSVMRNLLWMLEVANHRDVAETDTSHLEEAPTSFFDLFAYLLGKNLLTELRRGIAHAYVACEDDLTIVRGRIGLVEQVTRNWDRFDRVFCAWDEFTSDTAINRLFKCACGFLSQRVNYPEAARLLVDCQVLLGEVEDVSPASALRDVANLRCDRSVDRFKTAFDLARQLLAGIGHNLGVGSANTFVFLLDMKRVFESYVHAVLGLHFETDIETQKPVGHLFRNISPESLAAQPRREGISQKADYYWCHGGTNWIGDAKYKRLAKSQQRSLRFDDLKDEQNEDEQSADGLAPVARPVLSPDDVRQLTVYAELDWRKDEKQKRPNLMLLYPFVGPTAACVAHKASAWNESAFWLMPVQVIKQEFIRKAIPGTTQQNSSEKASEEDLHR
jgi:5-methylcytosine-specific restriction endonuclease McrBC regulatory subunit McrC